MSCVGLDLGSFTGVAVWYRSDAKPRLSTLRVRKEMDGDDDLGRPMERLRAHLADIHTIEPITHLFFEAAILPQPQVNQLGRAVQKTRIETVARLVTLAGMTEWFGYRIEAVTRQIEMQSWRKHFCGKGTGNSAELKKAAKDAAKLRGWPVENDHEADAAGVLDYGLACFSIPTPWRDAHLFGGVAA